MPQSLIVIFLLFFAILAFGWFYWQRAKTRTNPTPALTTPAETADTTDTTPAS
jgi:hypothetical protein